MKKKYWITLGLLLFVAASVFALVRKEMREGAPEGAIVQKQSVTAAVAKKVIAYYFHGTARCVSCRKIEKFTNDSIRENFSRQLKSGELEWKVVNVEEQDNRHFVGDYKLYTKSVVLSRMDSGSEKKWKNLEEVWNLLGNQDAFQQYIKREVQALLDEKS